MTGHGDDSDADLEGAAADNQGAEPMEDEGAPKTRGTMIAMGAAPPASPPPADAPASPAESSEPTDSPRRPSASAGFVPRRAFPPAAPKGRRERTPPAGHPMRETPGHFPNADFSLQSTDGDAAIQRGPLLGDTGPFPEARRGAETPVSGPTPVSAPTEPAEETMGDDSMDITAPHHPVSSEKLGKVPLAEQDEEARGDQEQPPSQEPHATASGATNHEPRREETERRAPSEEAPEQLADTENGQGASASQDPDTRDGRPSSLSLILVAVVVIAVTYTLGSSYFTPDPPGSDALAANRVKTSEANDSLATPVEARKREDAKRGTPSGPSKATVKPQPTPPEDAAPVADPETGAEEPSDTELTLAVPATDSTTAAAEAPNAADEPAPEPTAEPAPEPTTAASAPGDEPLARATSLLSSDPRRAFELAAALTDGDARQAALEVQTLAACQFDDGMVARKAFGGLRGTERRVRVFGQCLNEHKINLRYTEHDYHYRELIRMSQRALDEDKFEAAYDLARTSFSQRRSAEAGVLLGKLNCALNRKPRAEVIAIKSRKDSREAIVAYCATRGITLDTTPPADP